MTLDERNEILETSDLLKALGGQNGFSNLQPKIKHLLLRRAHALQEIVERDIKLANSLSVEEFTGETLYE